MSRHSRRSTTRLARTLAIVCVGLTPLLGCGLGFGSEAKNQWTKSFPLAAGGTLEIRNTNGRIDVQPTDATTVEVVAERVVRAATDDAAKAGLADFEITESVSTDRISLGSTTKSTGGGWFEGLSRTVNYTVKLPYGAKVSLHATNGDIEVRGLTGEFRARATNGTIKATALETSADVETTNGTISLEFAKVGDEGIRGGTTNGEVEIILPRGAKANLKASVTNGSIDTSGLDLVVSEQTRRSLDAKIGGGGPSIKLSATNGSIEVKGR